jgi:hypothetical protein
MTAEEIKTVWKQAKEEQNVSFRQLEGKSGYAAQDLCRIFNVKHNTRLTQLIDVCDVLGLEVVVRKKPVTADGSDKLYLCDPKKNVECIKTGCHIHGGECHYTSHEEYSL